MDQEPMPEISGKIITDNNFFSLEFVSNIYVVVLAMVSLTFLSTTLNLASLILLYIFCMYILWLVEWAWTKLYKSLHLTVHSIS